MEQAGGKVVSSTLLEIRFRFHVPLIEGEYTVTVGVADGALGEGQFKRTLVYAHNFTVLKILKNRNSILWSGIVNLQPSIFINKQAHV
jgi:lipopolysaccharide transport system ATP-binding protein